LGDLGSFHFCPLSQVGSANLGQATSTQVKSRPRLELLKTREVWLETSFEMQMRTSESSLHT
jgi:hypothetical protein